MTAVALGNVTRPSGQAGGKAAVINYTNLGGCGLEHMEEVIVQYIFYIIGRAASELINTRLVQSSVIDRSCLGQSWTELSRDDTSY